MKCPNCHNKTKVMHTAASVGIVTRYRLCMTCGYSFRTIEREEKYERFKSHSEAAGKTS